MKKVIQFNSSQIVEFENEIIAGISLDFKALTNVPALALINDLSKISLDIFVKKARKKEYLVQTTLNKCLIEKFEGTEITKEVFKEGNTSSYRVIVGFSGAIQLHKGETIEVKCYAQNTSFTGLVTSTSEITIESVQSIVPTQYVDKVEIVQVAHPKQSYELLDEMVNHVKSLLDQLELPYRVLRLCGGDLGFTSALTYDLEVFSAAQERWLEVSSVSNFETYQANRLKLRFRENGGKPQLAHTLNGSALALPRIVAALLENNQTAEGIKIPKVLVPYTGFEMI